MSERSFKQRLFAWTALASVFGLAASFSLPLAESTEAAEFEVDPGSQQALFSEVSVSDLPGSLADIEAVSADDQTNVSYSFDPDAVVNFPFRTPVLLTDGFGYRTAPVEQFHDAQDFAAAAGTPIQVIADGIVTEAGMATDGCGFGLRVEHDIDDATVTTRYCHMQLDSHDYEVGDEIEMGDDAGRVGNTGMSFGPHLHLAIRVDDEPVDPLLYLNKYSKLTAEELKLRSTRQTTSSTSTTAQEAAEQ